MFNISSCCLLLQKDTVISEKKQPQFKANPSCWKQVTIPVHLCGLKSLRQREVVMPYNMLWLDRLVERMCRYLDDRYPGGYGWTYRRMPRGSYFFKRQWMQRFRLGNAERPAFYFVVNNYDVEPGGFVYACRIERDQANLVHLMIPNNVDELFPAGAVADIHHIWFEFPNGFQVNEYNQQLDEAIWCDIFGRFLSNQAVKNFLAVDLQ